jgi:hypothetical protein
MQKTVQLLELGKSLCVKITPDYWLVEWLLCIETCRCYWPMGTHCLTVQHHSGILLHQWVPCRLVNICPRDGDVLDSGLQSWIHYHYSNVAVTEKLTHWILCWISATFGKKILIFKNEKKYCLLKGNEGCITEYVKEHIKIVPQSPLMYLNQNGTMQLSWLN